MTNFVIASPPLFIATVAMSDAAAQAQVPVAYYVATLSVLGTIVVVLKTWSWVRGEMKTVAKAETAALRNEVKHVNEKLDAIVSALQRFPCVRDPGCRTRSTDVPAHTPIFGIPVYSPNDQDPQE